MNTKARVVLAFGAGCLSLFAFHFFPSFPASESESVAVDSTATAMSLLDDYGLDRLEEVAEEEWLPAVEVGSIGTGPKADHLLDTIAYAEWEYYANQSSVRQNPGGLLPLTVQAEVQLLQRSGKVFPTFASSLTELVNFREYQWSDELPQLPLQCEQPAVALLLLDETTVADWERSQTQWLALGAERSLTTIYFGEDLPETLASWPFPLLQLPDASPTAQAMAVQMLYGGQDTYYQEKGWLAAQRLGHAPPEAVGIERERLNRIDRYVERAIRRKAIPGCQVLVAKSGQIVYDKTFGYHTYAKEKAVDHQSVYDLASLTKAAATTLGVMRLYETGQVDLAERLKAYLPVYQKTGLRYLRIRHLLSHHTGLQANLPIAHWLRQDDLFQSTPSEQYPLAVSNDFYLKEGVRETLLSEVKKVRTARRQFFRYSDVNFILLQQVVEQVSGNPMDDFLRSEFYAPLGLQRLRFRPGKVLPYADIAPTEHDRRWRKQIVQGEVHDESAALLGGVAGHAGLFSNARDLAVLFQMLINDGTYAGDQYFQPETVAQFTKRNGYNYRAYGFDRLAGHSKSLRYYGASNNTFGHTGFTGTCVWADPDEDLIFIFLSNRIHPNKYNQKLQKLGLRERIHKIIYQSLGSFEEEV
ncbi:MAG: serine hydrolase [Bacteroidota bacterium]